MTLLVQTLLGGGQAGGAPGQRPQEQLGFHVAVMDFVEGESLEKLMRRQRIPLVDVVRFSRQILDALAYAHENGVVHRDIKPANILITPAGDAILTDFGIAVAGRDVRLTQAGHTLGSLYYMSPEQISGTQEIDGRSDLYSLGIMIYEMATGQRAIDGPSDFSILAAHVNQTPKAPIEVDPAIPSVLSSCIMKAIAKDRAERFKSAADMRDAIDEVFRSPLTTGVPVAVASGPQSGGQPTYAETPRESAVTTEMQSGKRPRWLLPALAAGIVVILVAAAQLAFNRGGAPAGESAAEEKTLPVAPPPPPSAYSTPKSSATLPTPSLTPSLNQTTPGDARSSRVAGPVVIQIDSEPVGVNVSVDNGALTCTTPCALELTAGRHSIHGSRAGFRDALSVVEIPRDSQVMLRLAQRTGSLAVRSDPNDAQIFVNGEAQPQRTPAILNLPVGKYKIVLKKQGQPDYEDEIEVVDQVTRTMEVTWGK